MNYDLPDHPVIQNMERTGYPDGKEPTFPICPVCGEECEEIFRDKDLNILPATGAMYGRKHTSVRTLPASSLSFPTSSTGSGRWI